MNHKEVLKFTRKKMQKFNVNWGPEQSSISLYSNALAGCDHNMLYIQHRCRGEIMNFISKTFYDYCILRAPPNDGIAKKSSIGGDAVGTGVENSVETDGDDDETAGEVKGYFHPHLHLLYLLLVAGLWRQSLLCRDMF
jgi:hypothetical protein